MESLEQHGEESRYETGVADLDAGHPWHRIARLVPVGARVLDVGCGSGELGQFLSSRSDRIDGIEPNGPRAEHARKHLRNVVTGEGGPAADSELPDEYDVIIFADVIEHIGYPDDTLRWAASKLSADGTIVALIPNSANWKFRRKILKGDWSYEDRGYFDRDHLRFFNVRTARELGERVGLVEVGIEFPPERLPKPFNGWTRGAQFAADRSPNLFAGHVLIIWGRPPAG